MKTQHTPGPLMIGDLRLGNIVKYHDGFRFIPAMDSHKPSRKAHATPDDCIPAWARARLIAAAPETAFERDRLKALNAELVEALEQIASADHPDYPHFRHGTEAAFGEHLMSIARAVLAKAQS